MKRTKISRIVLFLLLIVTAIGSGFLYTEYNRKRPNATDIATDFSVDINSFCKSFLDNSKIANEKFLNKVVEFESRIAAVEKAENGSLTFIFKDSLGAVGVRCLIDSSYIQKAQQFQPPMKVRVKGVCTGFNPDDMGLGSDIFLQRTIVFQP